MTTIARNPVRQSNLADLLSGVEWTINLILTNPTLDRERIGVIRAIHRCHVGGQRRVFPISDHSNTLLQPDIPINSHCWQIFQCRGNLHPPITPRPVLCRTHLMTRSTTHITCLGCRPPVKAGQLTPTVLLHSQETTELRNTTAMALPLAMMCTSGPPDFQDLTTLVANVFSTPLRTSWSRCRIERPRIQPHRLCTPSAFNRDRKVANPTPRTLVRCLKRRARTRRSPLLLSREHRLRIEVGAGASSWLVISGKWAHK